MPHQGLSDGIKNVVELKSDQKDNLNKNLKNNSIIIINKIFKNILNNKIKNINIINIIINNKNKRFDNYIEISRKIILY